jgi:predicted amidohydrolase
MKIAAAQTVPADDNVSINIDAHLRLCAIAAAEGVDLVLFPEMSLTGYQREAAGSLAFVAHDSRLGRLREMAVRHTMIIVAGAPILVGAELFIGFFVLQPDRREQIYTKQFLHSGEESAFAA